MRYWFYHLSKGLLWVIFRTGFALEVRGQEHVPTRGGFIAASNHISYLDPPVLGAACPRRLVFMARATLFKQPLLGAFMRGVHVLPLKRGEGDVEAMREAVSRLQSGDAVAIFPEGTRQLSGTLGTAKRGVGLLAMAARVPIIPTLVTGTFEALPPADPPRLHRAKIRVAFGPAIPYTMNSVSSPGLTVGQESAEGAGKRAAPVRSHHQQLADALTQEWHRLLAEQLAAPSR